MSPPLEAGDLRIANEPSAQHQNPLQAEAEALRSKLSPKAGNALGDFVDGLESALAQVPDWSADVSGVMLGVLSRSPGSLGAVGKFASLTYGLVYLSDLGVRLTGLSNHSAADHQRAYQRDEIALGSLGAGFILGGIMSKSRLFSGLSKSSQPETKGNIIQFPLKRTTGLNEGDLPWENHTRSPYPGKKNLASQATGQMTHSEQDLFSAKIRRLDSDNLIYLNRRTATFDCKEKQMITEEAIVKFDQAKQEEIRKEIELRLKSGCPKEFLDLWPDGSVTYNSLGHQDAILLEHLEEQTDL